MRQKVIIINRMYAGDYLKQDGNIGHEIINLYVTDEGKQYIYLNSDGRLPDKYYNYDIDVILVRYYGKDTFKVLAKAENVTPIESAKATMNREKANEIQKKLNIKYGGKLIQNILQGNSYKNKYDESTQVYATFLAEKIVTPKPELLITSSRKSDWPTAKHITTQNGKFPNQSLRGYYHENSLETGKGYLDLKEILDDVDLWNIGSGGEIINKKKLVDLSQERGILNILGKENDELAFSNFFKYIFDENPRIFPKFAKSVLKTGNVNTPIRIAREEHHIDLLIDDGENTFIIENKIKSKVNGIQERHNIASEQVQSQLKDYYQYAENTYRKNLGRKCFYYIFTPDYNVLDLSKYTASEKYTEIKYSAIRDFFKNELRQIKKPPYYNDFLIGLDCHSKEYDDKLELEMKRLFYKQIRKSK